MSRKKAAVFLDRDGVINKKASPHDYIKNWKEFKFLPGVIETIKELNKKFLVIIITNQRGVSRGLMTMKDLDDIHKKMEEKLKRAGVKIDAIYFCPHDLENNCSCRKPKPGMILRAANDFNIDLGSSFFIGDDLSDVRAGQKVGCRTIYIMGRKRMRGDKKIWRIVDNLHSTLKIINDNITKK